MTINEHIIEKKAQANIAWNRYLQARQAANQGEDKLARIRGEIHANNHQELHGQVIACANLRALQDAQSQLDAEVQRAIQQSDEIEAALGRLLSSPSVVSQPLES